MICCWSSEWHFGAVIVKFLLNLIIAQKLANWQNTVRRLIIILLSLFFLLIIRASIWSPYGKNLSEHCYYQKDDQFAEYCHTPLSLPFHLVFWCLSSNRHFGTLTLKFLLNPVTKESMTNMQNTLTPRNHRFEEVFCCWSSERHFEILTIKIAPSPILAQNMANLQNIVSCLLFTVLRLSICV